MSEKSFIQHNVENKNENEKLETRNEKLGTRNEKVEMRNENKQFKKNNIIKEEPKSPIGLIKLSLKRFQLLLTATNLVTKIKQANSNMITLKTWLIILEIIQLVKQMLKKI